MGFSKESVATYTRNEYNLDDPVDREIIRTFESELEAYSEKEPVVVLAGTILEKKLTGFALYLHENQLFHYTREYPNGAVVLANVGYYREAQKKKRALDSLRYRRQLAREEENRKFAGTSVGQALESLGGTVVDQGPQEGLKEIEKKRGKIVKKMKA